MAKGDREQDKLGALRSAESAGGEAARDVIEEGLRDRSAAVVARAAGAAERLAMVAVAPALLAAAERLENVPAKGDPGCIARIALVRGLRLLNIPAGPFFRRMLTARQLEASAGAFIDVAVPLRAEAALAIAAGGDREAPALLCDLLFDIPPEPAPGSMGIEDDPAARIAAARGLGATCSDGAALALRAKLRAGRDVPEVLGECCAAIAAIGPEWGEAFLAEWLKEHPRAIAATAVGIGESRSRSALPLLRVMLPIAEGPDAIGAVQLGLALTRAPEAFDFLIEQLATAPAATSASALEALKLYERDAAHCARVVEAVDVRRRATDHG